MSGVQGTKIYGRMKLETRQILNELKPPVHGSAAREDVLDFSTNTYPVELPDDIMAAMINALGDAGRYPDTDSSLLREKISAIFNITPESIVVGNGTSEIIRLAAFCFGKKAFIPQPTFSEYDYSVLLYGGAVVPARILEENDFLVTEDVLGEMPRDTSVVFLCNPNNPTGRAIPKKAMYSFLEETQGKGIMVVVDEVYFELSDSYSLIENVREFKNLVVLRSLTKAYGLCGLRLGYAAADEKIIELLDKARPPWNVNSVAQKVGALCIGHPYIRAVKEMAEESKKKLKQDLNRFPVKIYPSESNFFLIDVMETRYDSASITKILLDKGVCVRDCASFPHLDKGYIRVGVKTPQMNKILIEKLGEVLE